ncbi:diphosphomevalonate decarboxylase [Reticulomyxa filosa]|uniref:Diphosphomevalonate decarboxylase n=1 Tax=Reticulomyxa filosa TaxID=46433 RepID=X6NMY6_RETFI|nr:diphosphomevalonate decarboxylase [Reticulomyxa filosa]|eukprot:ETO27293.1 diphosphomevalonate decarboxylase [Reticulomyxa filosa]
MKHTNDLCKRAIEEKNFDLLSEVMMKDSNQFHSVCLDSWPPIHYLNDISFSIIDFVHFINEIYAARNEDNFKHVCGYTFDAGSNAILLIRHPKFLNFIVRLLEQTFDKTSSADKSFVFDPLKLRDECLEDKQFSLLTENEKIKFDRSFNKVGKGVKQAILTKIGDGARITEVKFLNTIRFLSIFSKSKLHYDFLFVFDGSRIVFLLKYKIW